VTVRAVVRTIPAISLSVSIVPVYLIQGRLCTASETFLNAP
jgi:hypothetical protein